MALRYDRFYYKPLLDCLTISSSTIEGLGVFALDTIEEGTDLGETHIKVPMIMGYIRTPLGGFLNHAEDANCHLTLTQDWDDYFVYNVFTSRDIEDGEELTLNYDE